MLPETVRASAPVALAILAISGCGGGSSTPQKPARIAPAAYVGSEACADCHRQQLGQWRGSHHDLAMQPADPSTVLGDFDDATFSHEGVSSRFFKKDDSYWVHTEGPGGEPSDFQVAYTFGVEPLQQYLVEFPDGRLQALPLCWDSRPATDGGQRWFHIYPDERITHDDQLHWTGPDQNWNYMCAECHSTNLRKNYLEAEDRYETSWSEIDVSCEACHGPGSRHVEWAGRFVGGAVGPDDDPTLGLVVALADRDSGVWAIQEGARTATRSTPRASRTEVETCGRCHSRRTQLTDDYVYGRPLAETHRIALLDERLYHADGQILDEVYVYGSFVQSKMYREGVTCSDCHDPHGARLYVEGNAACARCHRATDYDTVDHHFHEPESPGGSCVACHMPVRTYMVVDPRHDHGFRVPRPELTVRLGTPNACNDCHADRSADWAAQAVAGWYSEPRAIRHEYADALHAGRTGAPGAPVKLAAVVYDLEAPAIARASALRLMSGFLTVESLELVARATRDDDPLVRSAAAEALEAVAPRDRWQLGAPLLSDPIRTVRMEAARVLAAVPAQIIDAEHRLLLDRALEEYRAAQVFNADRAEGHLNLGNLSLTLGDFDAAEVSYNNAMRLQPGSIPPYVNLADLYRRQNRDDEGERVLRRALRMAPEHGDVHHALGLLLARQGRSDEALVSLARGAELSPGVARYAYVYAVALHGAGRLAEAVATLEQIHRLHPLEREPVIALASFHRDAGDLDSAVRWARRLIEIAPDDPDAQQLLQQLESLRSVRGG